MTINTVIYMPYKKRGTAISSYLSILKSIAEEYGNPFILARLPDPLEVGGKRYSKETIHRYLSWVKKYYRDNDRKPPFRIEYVRDEKRGRVAAIYIDMEKIDKEIGEVLKDSRSWPYQSKTSYSEEISKLQRKIERLTRRVEELEEKLRKAREEVKRKEAELEKYRKKIEKLESENKRLRAKLKETGDKLVEYRNLASFKDELAELYYNMLQELVDMGPDDLIECIENEEEDLPCAIARIILDTAVTESDGITPYDVLTSMIDDEYAEKMKRLRSEIRERLKRPDARKY